MSPISRRLWFLVTLVVSLGCVALAGWQFQRRAARLADNQLAVAGRSRPVLDLVETSGDSARIQRRVVARGEFDHDREIVLRGHLLTGAPGVQVITPLRLAGSDSAVLVNRGFVPAADGATPDFPVPPEPGVVTIQGIALAVPEPAEGGQPVVGSRGTSWRRMDLDELRQRLPYPILDVYILAAADSGRQGWPRRVEPPALGEGPHLSYALQWLGIATAVLAFGVFVILGIGRRDTARVPLPPPPPG